MDTLVATHGLKTLVGTALQDAASRTGWSTSEIDVDESQRPELGDYQCNCALRLAKSLKKPPREVAAALIEAVGKDGRFARLSVDGPGFINITVSDSTLSAALNAQLADPRLGCPTVEEPLNVIIDYGGPNIAKPMHVGHLRSSIIGDCLKRIFRFLGHNVLGDIHLGDWGTQVGMVIYAIREKNPALPYFDDRWSGPYPAEPPVTLADLDIMYPAISARCKVDEGVAEECRTIIRDLQSGRPGYLALWNQLVAISVSDTKANFARLDISFDCWFGESRYNHRLQPLADQLLAGRIAEISDGAVVIRVHRDGDTATVPPFILRKSDGAALYSTSDLATVEERCNDFDANLIIYVVDERQHLHLEQLFRAASLTGISRQAALEHIGFGTMNGSDGKPFKTRAGGVLKLGDLIEMLSTKAKERLDANSIAQDCSEGERSNIANAVGIATLKFADLQHHRKSSYIFDLDRFSEFEGKTGPYIQYTGTRAASILRKAGERRLAAGTIAVQEGGIERKLGLCLARFYDKVIETASKREPHILCDYLFELSQVFNKFYAEKPILVEQDEAQRASLLAICQLTHGVLERGCSLVGIALPSRM
jgi:arginyl-tRNA synthetase